MPPRNWIRIENRCVSGLGQAELLQSSGVLPHAPPNAPSNAPSSFQAKLILNSYESNCLRDWLAQRWNAPSLEQCCVSLIDDQTLIVSLFLSANTVQEARTKFDDWLDSVLEERELSHLSRK